MLQLRPEQVRAWRLRAHHLVDDAVSSGVVDAARIGLPDTPPGSASLGVAARCLTATRADVMSAIADERTVAIVWARRGSPQLVPADEVGLFTRGLLPDDEESWRAVFAGYAAQVDSLDLSAGELAEIAAAAVAEALDGRELTKRELTEAILPALPASMRAGFEPEPLARFSAMLLRAASLFGRFVAAPRHDGELSFVRTDQWLGESPQDDPQIARVAMARRYLATYGPSRPQVFADWAGIGEGHARRAFAGLEDELVRVRVEGADGVVLASDADLLENAPAPEGLRLLPPHDAYLGSLDRRVIVPDQARHKAVWKAAGNPGAVLFEGEIAGAWRTQLSNGTLLVDVTEFRTLPKRGLASLGEQAQRIGEFKGARKVKVRI